MRQAASAGAAVGLTDIITEPLYPLHELERYEWNVESNTILCWVINLFRHHPLPLFSIS
jgi:hypothetical protein